MHIRFLDLSVTGEEQEKHIEAIRKVLNHGILVNGPEVAEFEGMIAKYCGRKFSVGAGSGSDALYLALRAHDIGHGDEVITSSMSWVATANSVALTGATPVFADINEDLNINTDSMKCLLTKKTRAILPVDYAGKIADFEEITSFAKEHGLVVIEDGSQAFGAEKYGRRTGSFGDISAISLNPMKILNGIGEAGIVLTDDENVRKRLESLRYNGTINRETCIEPGMNSRLDTIQAAVLIHRLKNIDNVISKRRKNASLYNEGLRDIEQIRLPLEQNTEKDTFYTYTIQTKDRDRLSAYLSENNIENKVYHPILQPDQPAYINKSAAFKETAEKCVNSILCLPIHEKLREDEILYVIEKIEKYYRGRDNEG